MKFALNASTDVSFSGQRFLHAAVLHRFASEAPAVTLRARARQFSSFILLIGKMVGKDRFEPCDALVVKNKDDVEIPLTMETIPSPKVGKRAGAESGNEVIEGHGKQCRQVSVYDRGSRKAMPQVSVYDRGSRKAMPQVSVYLHCVH
jgi:hypothetical protein